MSNDDLIARLRQMAAGLHDDMSTGAEAADALTAQANSLGFLRQISGQQAYEINQQAATIAEQAAEIERLRGIVPEVLERLNRELFQENEALQQSLAECVEDSEELLANYLQAYGDRYRVDRMNHMREQIRRARALLPDPELEWLTGCPECGMDAGCDCDSGTENDPEAVNPTWTREEIESAAYSLGMRYPETPEPAAPTAVEPLNGMTKEKALDWFKEISKPLAATPPQRKPLTEEEIGRVCVPLGFAQLSPVEIARAIEKAHGIGEQK